jgi:hypothetical protein
MDIDLDTFVNYMRAHATGPKHAKTRRTIERELFAGDPHAERHVRVLANQANQAGIPIASCNEGYFYAETFEDFEPMLSRLRHQRDEMHNRILAVERLRGGMLVTRDMVDEQTTQFVRHMERSFRG